VSTAELRALAARADGVEGHRDTRLLEVHERIGVARRRRRALAGSGAAAVTAIAVVTAIVLRPSAERTMPAPDPTPTPSVPAPVVEDTTLDRPLTYAIGQRIHYGDKLIDTGRPIAQVDITDAGVVFLTEDGELWFTDGSKPWLIERGRGTYDERLEVPTAATGSRIAWMRSQGTMPVEVVVYDVATRKVVFTAPAGASVWPDFDTSRPEAQVQVLTDDQAVAYYTDTFYNGRDIGQLRYVSYDLDTGRRTELSFDEFDDVAVAPPTRSLGWLSRTGGPDNLVRGSTDSYQVRDGVLTVRVFDDSVGHWLVADPVDPVTGEVLRIRVPAALADGSELRLFQWLDDGVFALVGLDRRHHHDNGAIVVCTLADLRCAVADPGPGEWITPGREFYE
jgi:hypothetical protein